MSFDEWFEREFGPPPFPESIKDSMAEVREAEDRLAYLNMKYTAIEHYNLQRASAKMAWSHKTDWHSA